MVIPQKKIFKFDEYNLYKKCSQYKDAYLYYTKYYIPSNLNN